MKDAGKKAFAFLAVFLTFDFGWKKAVSAQTHVLYTGETPADLGSLAECAPDHEKAHPRLKAMFNFQMQNVTSAS